MSRWEKLCDAFSQFETQERERYPAGKANAAPVRVQKETWKRRRWSGPALSHFSDFCRVTQRRAMGIFSRKMPTDVCAALYTNPKNALAPVLSV